MTAIQSRLIRAIIVAAVALVAVWLIVALMAPVGGTRKVIVQIHKGASAGSVSHMLADKRLIRSAFAFQLLARISGKSGMLKPGAYDLSPSMSPGSILNRIAGGEVSARWITIPEGFTVRQVAERLSAEGYGNADQLLNETLYNGKVFRTNFYHPEDSLEGYLFPDSYLLPVGASGEAAINEMLICFQRKVAEDLAPDIRKSGMSLHEVITLASLIEREARVPGDRPLVSAVLHNRLRQNMRLQCDATVLYALGQHKKRVLYRDLEVKSPYNTYLNTGLPPGPIANPGLDSIKAALHPARVDYLFYVAKSDGSHIFSRTMQEHERAIQLARRKDSH